MITATAGRLLCRRFGYLNITRISQHQPLLSQRLRFSTQEVKKGWMKENLSGGYIETLMKKCGFRGFTVKHKQDLENSAVKLYVSCAEYSDFQLFKERFGLKDTFAEWANVLHLHSWMLTTRLVNPNSPYLQNDMKFLNERTHFHMWADINSRAKKISKGSIRKKSIRQMSDHYVGMVLLYDEGFHSDDKTLAGALWKSLLDAREDIEPQQLVLLVDYVHRNLSHLETVSDDLLMNGVVSFLPLDSDKSDLKKDKRVQKILSALP